MGYTTLRNVHVETGNHSPHEISKAFVSQFDSTTTGLSLYVSPLTNKNGILDFDGITPRSWYCEKLDLKRFSMHFPSATIVVHGEGEEVNDIWEHVYHAGHCRSRSVETSWSNWKDE